MLLSRLGHSEIHTLWTWTTPQTIVNRPWLFWAQSNAVVSTEFRGRMRPFNVLGSMLDNIYCKVVGHRETTTTWDES